MKKYFIKFVLKMLDIYYLSQFGFVDKDKIKRWLFVSYRDGGWINYYTLRKKTLLQLLSLGSGDDKEYWKIIGRIEELKSLSANIKKEQERREKMKVKKEKK